MKDAEKASKGRFYWKEGVTRGEVVRALSDRRSSPLRRQGPRRLLVLSAALVMTSLAFTVLINDTKFRTYSEVILMVLGLILYAFLRQSVRLISEAPNELLDERQIALRDANYNLAYHILVLLICLYGALLYLISAGGWLYDYVGGRFWTGIVWSYILCGASLPAMLLAWNMPSEPEDEPLEQLANDPS
jgi:hypothetical protein